MEITKELIESIEILGNQLEIITKLTENIYFSIRKSIGIYGIGNNINYIRQHFANINLRYTEFHTWIFENYKQTEVIKNEYSYITSDKRNTFYKYKNVIK